MPMCKWCGEEFHSKETQSFCCSRKCGTSYSWSQRKRPVSERFWEKVDRGNPDECWEWIGARNSQGYGVLQVNRKPYAAHRFSYELESGHSAGTLCVLHRCDNPPCVNPDHLFLGTFSDNTRDMFEKHRAPSRAGELHGMHKLTENEVRSIRRQRATGSRVVELSEEYGVTVGTIYRIVSRKLWAHVE